MTKQRKTMTTDDRALALIALADRIRRDRLDRRLSWPAYAAWIGVKQSTIYKIANRMTTRPHELTVVQIEKMLAEPLAPEGTAREMVSDRQ